MNLIGITLLAPQAIQGLPQSGRYIRVAEGTLECLGKWRVRFHGTRAMFISARGYVQGEPESRWDPKGPQAIIRLDRSLIAEHWQGDEANLADTEKWPLTEEEQLERATAPKAGKK